MTDITGDEIGTEDIVQWQVSAAARGDALTWQLASLALDPGPDVPENIVTAAWAACVRRITLERGGAPTFAGPLEIMASEYAAREAARHVARVRQDVYVRLVGGRSVLTPPRLEGPFTAERARRVLADHRQIGGTGQIMPVAEDYEN